MYIFNKHLFKVFASFSLVLSLGVIAQEIEEVLPEVTTTRDNGYKAVKYEKIVPLLIECMKAQQTHIQQLEDRLVKLEKKD